MTLATTFSKTLLRGFERFRRSLPGPVRRVWGVEEEMAWRRLPLLKRRQATVQNRHGQNLRIRLGSLGDLHAAFGRDEEKNIPEVLASLPAGGVVLDIGAHIGGFSVIAAQAVGSTGKVYAFEPVADNADLLEQNAKLNGMDWLVPVRAAVGRQAGTLELLVSDTDTMWASSRSSWADVLHHGGTQTHTRATKVPMVTVDDFLNEHGIDRVALLKIDVEAAELDVLAGAAYSFAEGRIEQIIVEVHSPTVPWEDVSALLERYGYDLRDLGGSELHGVRRASVPLAPHEQAGRLLYEGAEVAEIVALRKPVTMAIVGCGAVAESMYGYSLQRLAKQGETEVVALVDPNPARTAAVGGWLPAARRFADLDAMFAVVQPEVVVIATPHRLHPELAVRCLAYGSNVLVEKPMAITTAECDEMIEAAERTDRTLAVGHFRRFFPACRTIKTLLESGLLGEVQSFRFIEGAAYDWPAASASYFNKKEAGGGVLIDAGVHTLDLLLWWLGDVADLRYADDAMGGVEANARLHLTMESGITGMVHLSRDWAPPFSRHVINCEKGWIAHICDVVDRVEWGLNEIEFGFETQLRKSLLGPTEPTHVLGAKAPELMACFEAQINNVCAAARGFDELVVPGHEARRVVNLVERCYANRTLLNMPWLSHHEMERARELAHG